MHFHAKCSWYIHITYSHSSSVLIHSSGYVHALRMRAIHLGGKFCRLVPWSIYVTSYVLKLNSYYDPNILLIFWHVGYSEWSNQGHAISNWCIPLFNTEYKSDNFNKADTASIFYNGWITNIRLYLSPTKGSFLYVNYY